VTEEPFDALEFALVAVKLEELVELVELVELAAAVLLELELEFQL